MTRTMLAIAVALQFIAAPVMAQGTSDNDANKHHYQGGPQTGVPHHMTAYPKSTGNANARATGGHHYSGGPKTESHHMGEKKQ